MGSGSEQAKKLNLRLSMDDAFDKILKTIDKKTKFSVREQERPSKIVAYGGEDRQSSGRLRAGSPRRACTLRFRIIPTRSV